MIQIQVNQHLLVPFGRPKWDISKIKIAAVSTTATHFVSETPCLYIDKTTKEPARFRNFTQAFPDKFPKDLEPEESLLFMRDYLKRTCQVPTEAEKLFLDLYFEYLKEATTYSEFLLRHLMIKHQVDAPYKLPIPYNSRSWVFEALMPLPQAHLYLDDPLRPQTSDISPSTIPGDMFKVDFAFWTGSNFVAVEIDGSSHIGSEAHIRKDRMLQRSGVLVIHILNRELTEHKTKVITALLPTSITKFLTARKIEVPENPLGPREPFASPWDDSPFGVPL